MITLQLSKCYAVTEHFNAVIEHEHMIFWVLFSYAPNWFYVFILDESQINLTLRISEESAFDLNKITRKTEGLLTYERYKLLLLVIMQKKKTNFIHSRILQSEKLWTRNIESEKNRDTCSSRSMQYPVWCSQ